MSTGTDLAVELALAQLGVPGTNLFVGKKAQIPAGPGPMTHLVEYTTEPPAETHDDAGVAYAKPRVQVVVHAPEYTAAEAHAWSVFRVLVQIVNRRVNGTRYQRVQPVQTPFDIGPDQSQRARVAFNVQVHRDA